MSKIDNDDNYLVIYEQLGLCFYKHIPQIKNYYLLSEHIVKDIFLNNMQFIK